MNNQQYATYDPTGRPYLQLALPLLRYQDFYDTPDEQSKKTEERVVIIDMTEDDLQTYEF